MRILKFVGMGLLATSLATSLHAQVSQEGGPIRVKADKSEVLERERKVILIDNVDITQGDARLRADIVTLEYADNASEGSGLGSTFGDIRTMTARGNVFYITPDLKANGEIGVYNAQTNTITVTGDVVLLRGEDVAKGERLTMNLTEGKTTLDGGTGNQVNMVITPSGIEDDNASSPTTTTDTDVSDSE